MAEIEHSAVRLGPYAVAVTWADVTNSDTCEPLDLAEQQGLAGSMEAEGTFTGTIALNASNAGTNYYPHSFNGDAVELADEGLVEFGTASRYLQPTPPDTGTATITIMLRG